MNTQQAQMMSNESLRKFARYGEGLSKLTFNQKHNAGIARWVLSQRDIADTYA